MLIRSISNCVLRTALLLLVSAAAGRADSLSASDTFSFSLLPNSGAVSGPAGSAVGWGFSITNNSSTYWLGSFAINSPPLFPDEDSPQALFGLLFADPLAPHATFAQPFNPLSGDGLYQLTWSPDATAGTALEGFFTVSANFCDAADCTGFVAPADDQSAAYTATVTGVAAVPEPGTILLLGTGLSVTLRQATKRRKKGTLI